MEGNSSFRLFPQMNKNDSFLWFFAINCANSFEFLAVLMIFRPFSFRRADVFAPTQKQFLLNASLRFSGRGSSSNARKNNVLHSDW